MTNVFKTLAIAGLLGTISAPAFAAAHLDMATMTCAQYKALSAEDQSEVATMAIAEIDDGDNGEQMIDSTKATEATGGDTTAAEATDGNTSAGQKADGDEDNTTEDSKMENALEAFNLECDRSPDTLVSEAAAGMSGTR
ncbi:MAG: HdeA/HdeB family chaperone [Sulfitobacter sp.]